VTGLVSGLGSYKLLLEYDPSVFTALMPCDLAFGPGGPGSANGPVDEADSSLGNADCLPDPGGGAPGSCSITVILEGLVLFGCAAPGSGGPGPLGSFEFASLLLQTSGDLVNRLTAASGGGLQTTLRNARCELFDTAGAPAPGSVHEGVAPYCRDLAVTVRVLEGDLDVDCDVDVTDGQLIASRYGAPYGGLLYSKRYDLEPSSHDLDIDIKDIQKVVGRDGSTCQDPIPEQPPLGPLTPFGE
jgi:hypothetical protein